MRRILSILALLALVGLASFLAAAPALADAAAPVSVEASPGTIAIDTLYNGTDLTVTGTVPAGSQVVVRLVGDPTTFPMKEKGKVFGLLWMNLDKVAFKDAPRVFLVAASPEVPAADVSRLGVPGLADRITVTAKDGDTAPLVAEFLRYQTAEKLYKENAGQVTLGADAGAARPFTAVLHMPSRLSPGAYAVEVLAIRDGAVLGQGDASVTAAFIGAPAFLADMAFGHGTLYGVLASIIAIVGGLVIGQIFSGSKGGAH
ncbi:Conserved hypothetical protein CHP02186-related, transmembrane [Solidesulfovibrio carbinoliphilus subsp. oakridgensis]|uniref:Transmembrane protein n=1 Tax=Solidesulfovibrio carbinoliphilus subsp. oakridgensis TaxID=694327 RepID=G7QB24_9BACT|nr:TIGR02186 family protein [Solidesulfovibrio carbinoliphilus]EHJ48766.1 Conserved hypothetical protein CHP02186-related, transmembrane [Solidesulfovibrio carbinoliphilus subsp. oakridgensis]